MKIIFFSDLCSACGACAVACMDKNDIDIDAGMRPVRIVREEITPTGGIRCMSEACKHCENAPCIAVCPTGCLYLDTERGLTLYDRAKCAGCRACEAACAFDGLRFAPDGRVYKCDGCIDRLRSGLIPACVKACPTGALDMKGDFYGSDTEKK